METEFAFRHHNSDPEKAAAVYESMKVRVRACELIGGGRSGGESGPTFSSSSRSV